MNKAGKNNDAFLTSNYVPLVKDGEPLDKQNIIFFEKIIKDENGQTRNTFFSYDTQTATYREEGIPLYNRPPKEKVHYIYVPRNHYKTTVYEMLLDNINGSLVYRLFQTAYCIVKENGKHKILATTTREYARICMYKGTSWKETFDGKIKIYNLGFMSTFANLTHTTCYIRFQNRYEALFYECSEPMKNEVEKILDQVNVNGLDKFRKDKKILGDIVPIHYFSEFAFDLSKYQKKQRISTRMPECVINHLKNPSKENLKKLNAAGWGFVDYSYLSKMVDGVYIKNGEAPFFVKYNYFTEKWSIINRNQVSCYNYSLDAFRKPEDEFTDQLKIAGIPIFEYCNAAEKEKEVMYTKKQIRTAANWDLDCATLALSTSILSIEQALKLGKIGIAKDIASNYLKGKITKKQEKLSLPDLLGITGKQVNMIYSGIDDINAFREFVTSAAAKKAYSIEQRIKVGSVYAKNSVTIKMLCKAAQTFKSIIKKDDYDTTRIYIDYLMMFSLYESAIKKEGANFTLNVKPSHIKQEHDKLVLFSRICKDKKYIRKFNPLIAKIRDDKKNKDKYEYTDGKYSIILPKNAEDIIREGIILGHCVGRAGYIEKMAKGDSTIVFLRKNSNMENPFFTIEITHHCIKQCFSLHDSYNKDPEVRDFLLRYAREKEFSVELPTIYSGPICYTQIPA